MELYNTDQDTTIAEVEPRTSHWGRLRGLMFQDTGRIIMMFDTERKRGVWMPFVPRSLDIAFLTADHEICGVTQAEPVSWHPGTWTVHRSPQPCQYIVEVEHGLLQQKQWETGDHVTW